MATDDTITLSGTPTHDAAGAGANTVIPRRLGHVGLVRELGRGGMGSVWLGRDEMLGREVAVKFLLNAVTDADDPGFARFLEGARAAAALRHSSLTAIHAAELINGVPYLVMEFVDGPTVAAVLERQGPLAPAVAHAIIDAVSDAISILHERGIVHRDIKPSNVLLDSEGGVFVTDFGLTCRRATPEAKAQVAGTPAYMAPEMFEGNVSPKSDVYALGIMLYEMVTGERPFRGSAADVTQRAEREAIPREPLAKRSLPEALIDVIERAVHVNPLFRHKSAATFRQAVDEAMGSRPDAIRDARAIAAVVARVEAQADGPPAAMNAAGEASPSYFDSLAQIAARKRGGTPDTPDAIPKQQATAPEQQTPTAELSRKAIDVIALHPTGELPHDRSILCIQCGYDLRGQAIRSRCPECGTSILESAGPDRLVFSSMVWLRKVVLGLAMLQYSALAIICPIPLLMLFGSMGFFPSDELARWIFLVFFAIAAFGPIVGVWLATIPDPDRGRSSLETKQMWMARIAVFFAGPFIWKYQLAGASSSIVVRVVVSVVVGVIIGAGLAGFGLVVARAVARIPDPKLSRRTRLDSIQLAVLLGLAPAMLLLRQYLGVVAPIGMFVLVVGLLWFWGRMGRCQKALQRVVKLARRD